MARWAVQGSRRTWVTMQVEADSAEEATQKAKDGQYEDVDTEPGGDLYRPAWTAEKAVPTYFKDHPHD